MWAFFRLFAALGTCFAPCLFSQRERHTVTCSFSAFFGGIFYHFLAPRDNKRITWITFSWAVCCSFSRTNTPAHNLTQRAASREDVCACGRVRCPPQEHGQNGGKSACALPGLLCATMLLLRPSNCARINTSDRSSNTATLSPPPTLSAQLNESLHIVSTHCSGFSVRLPGVTPRLTVSPS